MKLPRIISTAFLVLVASTAITATAATEYRPSSVEHIFLNDQGDNVFEVLIQMESGQLFRLDEVSFNSTRYQLFEDTASLINKHRFFRGFDDEDVAQLVWGITPFTADEIADVDTIFKEDELTVILSFATGDQLRVKRNIDQKFSSSVEVTAFVTEIINDVEELEGDISTSRVLVMHEDPYTGLDYFAPYIDSIVIGFDTTEKTFSTQVTFGNEELRSFVLEYKDSKEQILKDITATINELYVEYEDARFVLEDIEEKASWQAVPWMIDDIEEIDFELVENDGIQTLAFTARARLTSDMVGVIELNKVFNGEPTDLNAVAVVATEALEENELFMHDFNVSLVENIIRSTQGEELVSPDDDDTEENDEQENELVVDEDTESIEDVPTDTQEELIAQLVAFLLLYIAQNDLDVDTSVLLQ